MSANSPYKTGLLRMAGSCAAKSGYVCTGERTRLEGLALARFFFFEPAACVLLRRSMPAWREIVDLAPALDCQLT